MSNFRPAPPSLGNTFVRTEFNKDIKSGLHPEAVAMADSLLAKFANCKNPPELLSSILAECFKKQRGEDANEYLDTTGIVSEFMIGIRKVYITEGDVVIIDGDVWFANESKRILYPYQDPEYDYGVGIFSETFCELFEYRWPCSVGYPE